MQHRGFDNRWIGWMRSLLQSSSLALGINDSIGNWFNNRRGLKQENSLSPLLFILVTDTLVKILETANSENQIQGIDSDGVTGHIQCLQVADDTLVFCNAEKSSIKILKLILYAFELITGLKINFHKSQLIALGINEEMLDGFAAMLGCNAGKLPTRYLGISLHHSMLSKRDWPFLLEKITKRLCGWKCRTLILVEFWCLKFDS